MGGKLNNNVICCFCGESLSLSDAAVLLVKFNMDSDESQQLFCHREHLVRCLDKSIFLHPDFYEDDIE